MHRKMMCLLILISSSLAWAQTGSGDVSAVRGVLDAQLSAWNRGDVTAFMSGYEDSPETTFIGQTVRKGFQQILERYRKNYSTREQMGHLDFQDIDVRVMPSDCGKPEFALVTGRFHLQRTARGESTKDEGVFSLVFHKGSQGWKIVLDHTS